nr:putative ABC transporter permease [uncultured Butyrivibrio sp.]
MFNYIPSQWLFLFYFYSFFGWCWESAYVSFLKKRPVNRGFMRGPFLPLYGSGGIMMLLVSKPYYDNVLLVYIAGCIGATALEFITGIVMESLFKVRYWDYSHKKINFRGYISLESSLFWGVCTVVFTHYLQLPIEKLLLSIPYNVISITTIVLTIYFCCDFMIAFKTALELRDVLIYMEKAKNEMRRMQKRLDVIVAFQGEAVREGLGSKVEGLSDKVGEIGSGLGDMASAVGNGISTRMDVLSSALDKSFGVVKEKISLNPSEYVESVKDEVAELYTKYRIIMDKVAPHPVRNFFEWYKDRTIMGNPTMYSEKFKLSLEEVKEKASRFRNGHREN